MDNYTIILDAEQQFAREVTLGVIVTRPLHAWYYLIPGFFIIDFLRRGSAIRQYTQHFMFPRKLAIDIAAAELRAGHESSGSVDPEDTIKSWLKTLNLYSPELVQAHLVLIDILSKHYLELLKAEGDSFNVLIERAYPERKHFQEFMESISAAENEVDRQVMDLLGNNPKVREKMAAEQQQIAKRRQKILHAVF